MFFMLVKKNKKWSTPPLRIKEYKRIVACATRFLLCYCENVAYAGNVICFLYYKMPNEVINVRLNKQGI